MKITFFGITLEIHCTKRKCRNIDNKPSQSEWLESLDLSKHANVKYKNTPQSECTIMKGDTVFCYHEKYRGYHTVLDIYPNAVCGSTYMIKTDKHLADSDWFERIPKSTWDVDEVRELFREFQWDMAQQIIGNRGKDPLVPMEWLKDKIG